MTTKYDDKNFHKTMYEELLGEAVEAGYDVDIPYGFMTKEAIEDILRAASPILVNGIIDKIMADIESELICCDIFEKDKGTNRAGKTHAICFWGGAANALIKDWKIKSA